MRPHAEIPTNPGPVEVVTAESLVDALDRPHESPPSVILRAAAERWHFIQEDLLARVEQEVGEVSEGRRAEYSDVTVFALYLAAEKKASNAFPALLRLLSVEDTRTIDRFGEVFTDDMPVILADCFPGCDALGELEAIVRNSALAVACRRAVLHSLEILAWQQRIPGSQLKSMLQRLAGGGLEPDQPRLWTAFAETCLAGGFTDLEPAVLEAHRRGWIDSTCIPKTVLIQAFEQVRSGTYEPFSAPVTIDSAAEEVQEWNWGQSETPENGSPRTGRNDPCPCGSGKKFKRCCLGN